MYEQKTRSGRNELGILGVLQKLTIIKAVLGGKYQFDKMSFIERFLTNKIAKVNFFVSRLRYDAIGEFVTQLRSHLSNFALN